MTRKKMIPVTRKYKVGDTVHIKTRHDLMRDFGGSSGDIEHPIGFSSIMEDYCGGVFEITEIEKGFNGYPESYIIDDCYVWSWVADMFDDKDATNIVIDRLKGVL